MITKKIETPDESDAVHAAMLADGGHHVPCVSHFFEVDGKIVGAFSVAYAPCLFFWYDSAPKHAIGSARAFKQAVQAIKALGCKRVIVLINPESPFYRWIPKIGFTFLASNELWKLEI